MVNSKRDQQKNWKISTVECAENNNSSSMLENPLNLFWRVMSVKCALRKVQNSFHCLLPI